MKKNVIFWLLIFLVIGSLGFVSAESYVQRVYAQGSLHSEEDGSSYGGQDLTIRSDFVSVSDYNPNYYYNTKYFENSGYNLSMWNGNVPEGSEIVIDGYTYNVDCSEGCSKELFNVGNPSDVLKNLGLFVPDSGLNAENEFYTSLDSVKANCSCDTVVYYYNDSVSNGGETIEARLSYTQIWNGTPIVPEGIVCSSECDKIYNLGEYHLFVDFDASLPRDKTDWGRMWFDHVVTMEVSSNPEKNGKIKIVGEYGMDHLSYAILDAISDKKAEFYNQFVLNSVSKGPQDLMFTVLDRLFEKTGKSTGKITISSLSVDKNNKLWNMIFKGSVLQERSFSASTSQVYNPNLDILGPFNREEVASLVNLFGTKMDEIITKNVTLENGGKPTSSSAGYEKYKGTKKVDGKNHYIEIEKFYKNGKLIKIRYLEHINGAKETKTIIYILPEKDIKEILKEVKARDGKTNSQSVWSSSFPLNGIAIRLSPSYIFNEPVELNFTRNETFFHFDDSVIENTEYTVLDKVTRTIGIDGGELSNSLIKQIFPQGAVLSDTNFSIEIINITKSDLCLDMIQDNGEQGIDCGGLCNACDENCNDGVENQNEAGIDCGGVCILDINESCGYDSNHDCSFSDCIPESCSSDNECSLRQGLCINNSCDYETNHDNFLVMMERLRGNERTLKEVMDYAYSLVNIGNFNLF